MEIIHVEEEPLGSSAKPSEIVVIPDSTIRKLSAVHVVKDELLRIAPTTSVSSKYSIMIKVIE